MPITKLQRMCRRKTAGVGLKFFITSCHSDRIIRSSGACSTLTRIPATIPPTTTRPQLIFPISPPTSFSGERKVGRWFWTLRRRLAVLREAVQRDAEEAHGALRCLGLLEESLRPAHDVLDGAGRRILRAAPGDRLEIGVAQLQRHRPSQQLLLGEIPGGASREIRHLPPHLLDVGQVVREGLLAADGL